MRILHVNKFLYRRGGAEAYMEDVAELQAKAGHEIAFFGMHHPQNRSSTYEEHFPPYVEFDPPPAAIGGKLRAIGRMFGSPAARRGIEHVVERFRPDVVHLHNIYHQLSPSILEPLARRAVPAVMTLHDYKLVCPTYLMLDHGRPCEACLGGGFHNAVLRRCKNGSLLASAVAAAELSWHTTRRAYDPVHVFICPSRFIEDKMRAGGVFPERLRVVPHFVERAAVQRGERSGRRVVYAGRLSSEKGVDVLIEALGRLSADTTLDLLGDGPERESLVALAERAAPGRVRFHGRLPRERALALVASATVVALPSRCYENQPLLVLEAFAAGVPVVGSDHGGIPELITAGVDGRLVPPGDPAALAEALGAVLADPKAAAAMGRAGRRKVEQGFSPEGHLRRLDEIYVEATERTAERESGWRLSASR